MLYNNLLIPTVTELFKLLTDYLDQKKATRGETRGTSNRVFDLKVCAIQLAYEDWISTRDQFELEYYPWKVWDEIFWNLVSRSTRLTPNAVLSIEHVEEYL